MCGIFCVYNKDEPINENKFTSALKLLNHRGPDEQHLHIENKCLGFGHTRLSIVGITNGQQPLFARNNDLITIINGEFYDYKTTKKEFSQEGYKFNTLTDSEIIFPLYMKYGFKCFSMLNGEFAGVLYDKKKNILIGFRDRHGIKPLFFDTSKNGIAFSSEIKSILKYYQIQPEYNIKKLTDSLLGPPADQDQTIFKNIFHIKPGHYTIYNLNNHELTTHKYWEVNYDPNNYFDTSLDNILFGYEKVLTSAINRRLVADVPTASYLSGGIDSSVAYGIASTLTGKGLDAFTISFTDKDYDEKILAEKLVKKYAGKQHILNVNDKLLSDNFSNYLWQLENMTFNPHGIAKYLLSNLVRENNYKVVITGEGSDEYNCGYITSVIDAMNATNNFEKSAIEDKLAVNTGVLLSKNSEDIPYIKKAFGFDLSFFSNIMPQIRLINNLLKPDYQYNDPTDKFKHYLKMHPLPNSQWDPLNTSLYYQSITTFSYVLTALGDRTEMAHSVEARLPFLDNDVVNFICRVNPKYKFYKGVDKFVLRESCRKYVTQEHFKTKKHPYLAPPTNKGSIFNQMMRDEFTSTHFINRQLFNHKKLITLLDKMESKSVVDPFINKILFNILSFAVLDKLFNFA